MTFIADANLVINVLIYKYVNFILWIKLRLNYYIVDYEWQKCGELTLEIYDFYNFFFFLKC